MRSKNKATYFERVPGAPEPIVVEVKRRVRFNEADPMAIAWHGRYPLYFEAGLRAPVVEFHIDYYRPLFLDEEFTIKASLIWHEGSRLNIEYLLIKQDKSIASSAYIVHLFTDHQTGEPFMVSPELLERCRRRWKAGEFHRRP